MIVITGAAGFIGSYFAKFLNEKGQWDLILVDDVTKKSTDNLKGVSYGQFMDKTAFIPWLETNLSAVSFIFHLGARTDTTEKDEAYLLEWNTNYSKRLWQICTKHNIPFIYASSAATYGLGENGYKDDHSLIPRLKPLNYYAWSKQYFDEWVIQQTESPDHWYGFKFFNVFGPHENHKMRMASVVYHGYHQILNTGTIKLFRSNEKGLADGDQKRDFIYVLDIANIMYSFYSQKPKNGIYNLGTGEANTFNSLAENLFAALNKNVDIEYIPFPEDLKNTYQNFTQAETQKLKSQLNQFHFTAFDVAIQQYVDYLNQYV